jgi:hypothetical protein
MAGLNVSLRSFEAPQAFLCLREFRLFSEQAEGSGVKLANCSWKVISGLAGAGTLSFEATLVPGHFIRCRGMDLYLDVFDGSESFRQEASFRVHDGISDMMWNSFESVASPGSFLGRDSASSDRVLVKLVKPVDPATQGQCTWQITHSVAARAQT